MTTTTRQRRRPPHAVAAALLVLVLVGTGCSVAEPASTPNFEKVVPSKFELELVRCSVETDEEYRESISEPSIGGDTSRRVIAEYRLTNRDDVRRRFDIRATRVDSTGNEIRFIGKDSARLDPGESIVEQLSMRVVDADVPPYTCAAEVWDSVIDVAFPDD